MRSEVDVVLMLREVGIERWVGFVSCMIGALLEGAGAVEGFSQSKGYLSITVRISLICFEYSLSSIELYSIWKE